VSNLDESTRKTSPLRRRTVLTESARFGPNMTPMVDVTLVILIFFMASATIGGLEWFLRAELPKVRDPALQTRGYALPTPTLDAELFVRDGRVFVRGISDEARELDSVLDQIRAMDPALAGGLILGISASDEVPYWAVVALQDAGASRTMRVAIR